jgi:HEAT repeat protein
MLERLPDSGVAMVVLVLIAAIAAVNAVLVIFICSRRGIRSTVLSYVRQRERAYSETVYGTLIDPPDRSSFLAPAGTLPPRTTLRFADGAVTLRPGDLRILERMFLRLAAELRGADRDTMTGIFEDAGYVDRQVRSLRSRHWRNRLTAARKLAVMRSSTSTPALIATLDDSDRDVRIGAMRALGDMGDARAHDPMLAAMEDETRWESALIADVVLTIGPSMALPILQRMRETRDESLRAGYVHLLGLLREPAAVSDLLKHVHTDNDRLRMDVIRALGNIGDSRVAGSLLPCLDDSRAEIRAATAEALGKVDEEAAVEPLGRLLDDPVRLVRYKAARALVRLGTAGRQTLVLAAESDNVTQAGIARQVLAENEMGLA